MGLDMYLEARTFISGYSHETDETKALFNQITEAVGMQDMQDERFVTVNVNVAYWRKANHIHNWFVNNVQDGEDDCKSYWVSREKLMELEEVCRRVVANGTSEYAQEHLPTSTGFFFGTDEYDEYYYESTDWTAKRLAELLIEIDKMKDNGKRIDFYYQASW